MCLFEFERRLRGGSCNEVQERGSPTDRVAGYLQIAWFNCRSQFVPADLVQWLRMGSEGKEVKRER